MNFMNKIKKFLTSDQFIATLVAIFCMIAIIISLFSSNLAIKIGALIFFGSLYTAILYTSNEERVNIRLIIAFTFPMILFGGMIAILSDFEKDTKIGKLTFLHAWTLGAGALFLLFSTILVLSMFSN